MNKKDSHIRSVIKGISWRFIATTDTILIVLLITCLNGSCSIENALKIGAIEFLIKLFIYYFHERIWQFLRKSTEITKRQSLFKTTSWRIVATTTTFLISGAVLQRFDEVALYIALLELTSKFILYYIHERLWLKLPIGFFDKFTTKNN